MTRSRHLALLLVTLAFAFLWRLPVTESEWDLPLCENDSLFQLHRIAQTVSDYPAVRSVDPFSHYPEGFRVHWLAPHTLIYATGAKLLALPGDPVALAAVLSWIPPLLGLVAVVLAFLLARRLANDPFAAHAAALLCALAAIVCRPFFYGIVDHHLFAHLGLGLLVLAVVARSSATWAAGLLLSFATSPESSLYVTFVLVVLVLAAVAGGSATGAKGPPFNGLAWWIAPAGAALAAWALDRALQTQPLSWTSLRWFHFSALHVLWFAWLGGAGLTITRLPATASPRARWLAIGPVLLAGGALAGVIGPELGAAFERLVGSERLHVDEEVSVLAAGFPRAPHWVFLLAAGGVLQVAELVRALRRRAPAERIFPLAMLPVLLVLGLAEWRHLYVAGGVLFAGVAVALFALEARLRRLAAPWPRLRFVPGLVLSAGALVTFVPGNVLDRAGIHGDPCRSFPLVREVATWFRTEAGAGSEHDAGGFDRGVVARWSVGHQIHVLGGQPVVFDPFNYRVEEPIADVWRAESADALDAALRRRRARYVALVDPVGDVFAVRANPTEPGGGTRTGSGASATVELNPELSSFALFRLYLGSGLSSEFPALRLRHLSRERHVFGERSADRAAGRSVVVPEAQIYEVVRGATITGEAPEGVRAIEIDYTLLVETGERIPVRVAAPVAGDGSFRFRTGLPAPVREASFAIPEAYRLSANGAERRVVVSPQMVRDGGLVRVAWESAR